MATREERRRESRVRRAREAVSALDDMDRRALFREFGVCHCAAMRAYVTRHPLSAVGAAAGAIVADPFLRGVLNALLSTGGKR